MLRAAGTSRSLSSVPACVRLGIWRASGAHRRPKGMTGLRRGPARPCGPSKRRAAEEGAAQLPEGVGEDEDDKSRSVMLREKDGAPITVLEPAKYYSIKTDEYELLIAMDAEGRLDLSSCFIVDDFTGISSRAAVSDRAPKGFRHYMEVPWTEEDTGDLIMGKKGSITTPRRYFVEVTDRETVAINMEEVFVFENNQRSLSHRDVIKGEGWDDDDAYLRFLDNGSIVLQSSESTPTPEEIVRKNWERFVREGGLTRGVPQEIDNRDDDIEFDLDVPEVDMS